MKTRQEVERELMNLLEKADEIIKEYSPNGGTLTMAVFEDFLTIYNGAAYDRNEYNDNAIDVVKMRDGRVLTFWTRGNNE